MKTPLTIMTFAALAAAASADWVEVPGTIPGATSTPGFVSTTITASTVTSSLEYDKWYIHYDDSTWQKKWDSGNGFVINSGVKNQIELFNSQAAIRFDMPCSDFNDAEKVKVSFNIQEGPSLGFDIGVGDWDDGDDIILGRSLPGISPLTSGWPNDTTFTFSLINLDSNTVVAGLNNWVLDYTVSGPVNVSFEMSAADICANTLGYALLIESSFFNSDGTAEWVESYVISDFKVEKWVTSIPEPATATTGLMALGLFALRRRKIRPKYR